MLLRSCRGFITNPGIRSMNKFMLLLFMVLAVSASSISADPVPDKDKVKWAVPLDCIPPANQMNAFLPSGQAVADTFLPTVETLFTPTPCATPTPCSVMLQQCFVEIEETVDECWGGWCLCVLWYYQDYEECGP